MSSNRTLPSATLRGLLVALLSLASLPGHAQTVSAQIQLRYPSPRHHADSANVVLWLTPLPATTSTPHSRPAQAYTLTQKNKTFSPHLLVVPTGSSVDFPNLDPFFHNVFSLFNGKRFDLGLYEAGSHHTVRFDREGVSYIFCNIHPQMGAVVVALSSPWVAVSAPDGRISLPNVPPGDYQLHLWAENVSPAELLAAERILHVPSANLALGTLALNATPATTTAHKNKFGEDYKSDPTPY